MHNKNNDKQRHIQNHQKNQNRRAALGRHK